jgi:hypothetical protein
MLTLATRNCRQIIVKKSFLRVWMFRAGRNMKLLNEHIGLIWRPRTECL